MLRLVGAFVGSLLLTMSTGSWADEGDEPEAGRVVPSAIEEIVVTSKRSTQENIQDMPEAITAFSGTALERQHAVSLEDLNHVIPNVQLEHVGLFQAAASFSMRGIGTAGIESFADPVVAVFVDDAYYARNAVALMHLFDVESITARRGPQGTLYGRNAFAGAIAVRTKRPQLDEWGAEVHLDYGNHGRFNSGGVVNIPLIKEKVALRVATQYHRLEGFFKNDGVVVESYDPATATLVTRVDGSIRGDPENGERSVYVRPSLRISPSDNWELDIIGEIWDDKGDGTSNWSQCYELNSTPLPPSPGPSGISDVHTALGFPCKDPFGDDNWGISGDGSDPFETNFGYAPNQTDQDIWGITLNGSYDAGFGTFHLMFSHRDVEEDITTDTDGFNYDVFASSRLQDYEATQAELRLNTTIGDDIDLITGLYFLSDEYVVQQYLWIFLDSPLFGGGGYTRDNPLVSWGSNEQERFSMAGYAQADWHFAERWTLTLGGRLTYEEKDDVMGMAINDSNCPAGETPATAACNGVPFRGTDPGNVQDFDPSVRFGPVDEDWTSFSPRVGLQYQLNDDVMLFGHWQRAFKSGGFVNNAGTRPVFESAYDDEQVDNFEFGMNSDWLDNRLRVNIRAFYAEYEDLQRGVIRAAPTSTGQETFVDNAAGAESFGAELSFTAVPLDGLTLSGDIGWLDIEYDDFQADLSGDGIKTDNSGLDLVRAPEWDMHLAATYTFDLEDYGAVAVGLRGTYTDDMFLTTPNDVRFDRQRMVTWDAQLNWDSADGRYTISLWGRNLNGDVERLGGTPVATLFAFASASQPTQYGVTVTARFGR